LAASRLDRQRHRELSVVPDAAHVTAALFCCKHLCAGVLLTVAFTTLISMVPNRLLESA
jgi:hypothetical protein